MNKNKHLRNFEYNSEAEVVLQKSIMTMSVDTKKLNLISQTHNYILNMFFQ